MSEEKNKIMTVKEAIRRFVKDGDHLCIGNYTVASCTELVYEVVRQQKKNLTVYSQSGVIDVEMLAAFCGFANATYRLRLYPEWSVAQFRIQSR
jgi:glutaconate CoA-transferase subunit A